MSNQQKFAQWLSNALALRMKYLSVNPDCFKGNRRERFEYLQSLEEMGIELTDFQFEACVGLCLSDASLQSGSVSPKKPEKTLTRLKMTHPASRRDAGGPATKHENFLNRTPRVPQGRRDIKDVLRIYTANEYSFQPRSPRALRARGMSTRSSIYEFPTFRCKQLSPLATVFSDEPPQTNGVVPAPRALRARGKKITTKLKPFITPVSVAYWFCGDGGKADMTAQKGKGISFHTQCFSQEECELLASFLRENLGLDAFAKLDRPPSAPTERRDKVKNQYRVDILGPSFDKFIEVVGPYIHSSMSFKFPVPREEGSRFGKADASFVQANVSSFFKNNDYLSKYSRNM